MISQQKLDPTAEDRRVSAVVTRATQMCANPTLSSHLIVSTGILVKLLAAIETRHGIEEAISFHKRLNLRDPDDYEIIDLLFAIGHGTVTKVTGYWLGTMEYVFLENTIIDIIKERGFLTSRECTRSNGSSILEDYALLQDGVLTLE